MRTVYIADDGKEFDDEWECKDYEWKLNHHHLNDVRLYDKDEMMLRDIFSEDTYNNVVKIIVPTRKIQNRIHKKKRINKKWAKRYGFTISETLKNGETYIMDGKLYMNQHTYTQLKTSIEFENLLKR